MRIPSSFSKAQAKAFCDKTISHMQKNVTSGSLGGQYESPSDTVLGTYACNVQVIADQLLAEQYGLTVGRDISITAQTLPVGKTEFIRYAGVDYVVVEAPKFDAYQKLLAKRVSP